MDPRPLPNPVTVNDSLLYELILEVRALRALLEPKPEAPSEGDIELREPAKKAKKKGE